jgi:hypothetical protein
MKKEQLFEKARLEVINGLDTITSIQDAEKFHMLLIQLRVKLFQDFGWDMMPHYRGEQNFGWDIRCGIFRPPLKVPDAETGKMIEKRAITDFETAVKNKWGNSVFRDIFNHEKHGKEWDLLFQAQHAGIKTTLTDWSAEMITALYFATEESNVEEYEKADGQIWTLMTPTSWILGHNTWPERETFYDLDPFAMTKPCLINVASYLDDMDKRIYEQRMYRQKGRFIISEADKCDTPLNSREEFKHLIHRLRIPAAKKKAIRNELSSRGITTDYMYIEQNEERGQLINATNKILFEKYM